MRYALTGATGFVGGELAAELRRAGHEVVALVRDRVPGGGSLADLGVELVPGDLDDAAALDRLCSGVDGLFHVAGWYKLGQRDPSVGERVNVTGTRNVLEAARRNDVPKVVYTSTLAVNSDTAGRMVEESYRFTGEHLSHYDRTKAAAHHIAEEMAAAGLPVVIVQPGLVYGPGDTAATGTMLQQVVRRQAPARPGRRRGVLGARGRHRPRTRARDGPGRGRGVLLPGRAAGSLAEGLRLVADIAGTQGPSRGAPDGHQARRAPGPGSPSAPSPRRDRGDAARLAGDVLGQPGQGRARARLVGPPARRGPARDGRNVRGR